MFMKKVILISVLLGCSAVFAQTNETLLPKGKAIYCPIKITCENKTCTFDSEDTQYFGKLFIIKNDGSPLEASYPYKSTTANFHSNNTQASCNYGNLRLEIKAASNLEAYRIEGSSWMGTYPTESCSGNCPLHESMGLVIINGIHSGGVYASIVQQDISKLITDSSHIIFDDALLNCGGVNECVIDLLSDLHEIYGNIVVDMETMKILQVNSLDPAIKIKKIDDLNAVEINKIEEEENEEAIYCPPVLKCHDPSCTFTSLDAKYFGDFIPIKWASQLSLKFNSAHVDDNGFAYCTYTDKAVASPVTLKTNYPDYRLEKYSSKSGAKWVSNWCTPTNGSVNDCPLKRRTDVLIHNVNIGNGLYASAANIYQSQLVINNSYLSLIHDAVLGCGDNTKCTIDLLSSQQARYGTVTIDMKTMKILRVDSLYPNYIKISKVSNALYDLVEVRYVTDLKHIPLNLH